jgi:hypothetical protein
MHCHFYNGPLDGWTHECPAARVGEEWRVPVTSQYPPPFCVHERALGEAFSKPWPIARYQVVAPGVMRYRGLLQHQYE